LLVQQGHDLGSLLEFWRGRWWLDRLQHFGLIGQATR
jgi:hypothetical protein